jgi:glycosyltransferase involved in cell wall biosynthesis
VGLEKTVVAPLGVDEIFGQPQPRMVEPNYLLAVGDTHEFKNIPRLREVHATLNKESPLCLAVVGRPSEAEPDDWGSGVIRFEQLPASNLAALYQHCAVYIQPSLYEGSGVTVLEAMRAGAPVAAARVGGIPEVAGDIPFFFNPENVGSMAASIRRIFEEDPAQRRKRIHPGERMAAEFTWEKCAWKTLGAFKKA